MAGTLMSPPKTPAGMSTTSYRAPELPHCSQWEQGSSAWRAMDWEPNAAGMDLLSYGGALLCVSFRRMGCVVGCRQR